MRLLISFISKNKINNMLVEQKQIKSNWTPIEICFL